jgi:hypothetical protein
MRFRWLIAAAATFLSCGAAPALPDPAGPTIELRVRSVNDLVDRVEYAAGLFGKEDVGKQARELVKGLTADGKGIEGIDPKHPIGAYATLAKEVDASPVVVLIPIADEERFLKALAARFNITPEKADDGTLKAVVPVVNELSMRFANGYLYVSPKAQDLDPKVLIKPAAFFARDDGAVVSLLVHIDRIPADLRKFALGQIELGINESRKKDADKESAAEKRVKNLALDAILSGLRAIADDGKDLSVKLFADPKTDDISAEVTLTATDGSVAAKNFAALGARTSLPAGVVAAANPVARSGLCVGLTDGSMKKAPGDQEEVVKEIVAAVSPTLKAGVLDAASTLVGPDAKGHYRFVGAVGVREGKGIEKLVKDLIGKHGPLIEGFVTFKFDVETVGDFALHRIDLKQTDDKFDKVFGTGTIWLATSDTCLAFSIEPEGDTLRKGLKAKPIPTPVVAMDVAAAKLLPLMQELKADELKAVLKDAFGDGPTAGKDAISFGVEGGTKLSITLKAKGKALRAFAGVHGLKEQ